jgi:hypothetical protein
MKIKVYLLISIVIAITNIIGCDDESTGPSNYRSYIMPLAVGNKWINKVHYIDSLDRSYFIRYDTLKIIKDTIINGRRWFKSNEYSEYISIFYSNDSKGLSRMSSPGYKPLLIFKYPAQENDEIVVNTDITPESSQYKADTSIFGYKVISTDTLIKTTPNQYICYHYRGFSRHPDGSATQSPNADIYYAPGFGPIKWIAPFIMTDERGSVLGHNRLIIELLKVELH